MRIEDRHGRPFVLQPTSEELFVETAKHELKAGKVYLKYGSKFRLSFEMKDVPALDYYGQENL